MVDDIFRAGRTAEDAGDFVAASAAFDALRAHPDERIGAEARLHLGRVLWKLARFEDAFRQCQEANAMAMRVGADDLRAQCDNAIGVLHYTRGEYAQARASYANALERTEDPVTRAKITLNLGVIANIEGQPALARKHYEQCRRLFKRAGDERGEALALHNIGMLRSDAAEWEEADDALGRALALFEAQGNRQMIANTLVNRAEVACGRLRPEEGVRLCDTALQIYAEIGDETGRGEALRWKAHALRLARQLEASQAASREALRIAEKLGLKLLEAESARELGASLRERGDKIGASRMLESALRIFEQLGASEDADAVREELRSV